MSVFNSSIKYSDSQYYDVELDNISIEYDSTYISDNNKAKVYLVGNTIVIRDGKINIGKLNKLIIKPPVIIDLEGDDEDCI